MYSYIKPILFILLLMITACKTVPVTGRKQLNLVPNSIIQAMAFSQYDSVVKISATFPPYDERAQLVTAVGTKIQRAVETYLQQNNMSKEIKTLNGSLLPLTKTSSMPGVCPVVKW